MRVAEDISRREGDATSQELPGDSSDSITPLFSELPLGHFSEAKRKALYWFIQGIEKKAGSTLPLTWEYFKETPSLFLDLSRYNQNMLRLIHSFVRQVRGGIPRFGDVPLELPVDLRNQLMDEQAFTEKVKSPKRPILGALVQTKGAKLPWLHGVSAHIGSPSLSRTNSPAASDSRRAGASSRVPPPVTPPTASASSRALPPLQVYTGRAEASDHSDSSTGEEPSSSHSHPLRGLQEEGERYSGEDPDAFRESAPRWSATTGRARSQSRDSPHTPMDDQNMVNNMKEMSEAQRLLGALPAPREPFSGDVEAEKEKLTEWLHSITTQLQSLISGQLLSLTHPRCNLAIMQWIGKHLRGSAAQWWSTVTIGKVTTEGTPCSGVAGMPFITLDAIKDAFKRQYPIPGAKEKALLAFNGLVPSWPKESMTAYNARFSQAASQVKLAPDVIRYRYYTSLPATIREKVSAILYEKRRFEGQVLDPEDGNFTFEELKQLVISAEYEIQRHSKPPVSGLFQAPSVHQSRAGFHHAYAGLEGPPYLERHPSSSTLPQPGILDVAGADFNAMGTGHPSQPYRAANRGGRPHFLSSSERIVRSGPDLSSHPPNRERKKGSSSSQPRPRDVAPSPQRTNPVFTRGLIPLTFQDFRGFAEQATKACNDHPCLSRLEPQVLISRIKQKLCYGCGMKTNETHTTDSCRGKVHLN